MQIRSFKWEEASIADLRAAMDSGKQTASSITQDYLDWIAAVDKSGPAINAMIELNPDALKIAKDLDAGARAKARAARCTAFRCWQKITSTRTTG